MPAVFHVIYFLGKPFTTMCKAEVRSVSDLHLHVNKCTENDTEVTVHNQTCLVKS